MLCYFFSPNDLSFLLIFFNKELSELNDENSSLCCILINTGELVAYSICIDNHCFAIKSKCSAVLVYNIKNKKDVFWHIKMSILKKIKTANFSLCLRLGICSKHPTGAGPFLLIPGQWLQEVWWNQTSSSTQIPLKIEMTVKLLCKSQCKN